MCQTNVSLFSPNCLSLKVSLHDVCWSVTSIEFLYVDLFSFSNWKIGDGETESLYFV